MMMKAAPASSFVLAKTELLLEILVVPLDPPTQFRRGHQRSAADGRGQSGEEILGRFGFARGPFDQTPFLGAWRGTLIIAMRRTTRTAAKREASWVLVPSRQVTCRQAFLGKASASCLAETG